jgi:hypothetical protein
MSSAIEQHADDLPSTSYDTIGKKKSRVKFLCMLCKGNHLTHLCPRMDKASKLLEDMTVSQPQFPTVYSKFSLNPPVVDGMITRDPSPINLIDHVINLVTSLIEPVDIVVNPIPFSIDPTLPLESVNKVVDPITSSVNPTLLPESEIKAVNLFPPVDPILPLENATHVVDLISSSVDPTLPLESKPNIAHIFLVDTDSAVSWGIPPSPMKLPPSNEAILFN